MAIKIRDKVFNNLPASLEEPLREIIQMNSDAEVTISTAQTITGAKTFSSAVATDSISETTATAGVTVDGALVKDGSFTGKQATVTATADGLTTGLLTGADQFVTVTSANVDHIVALPAIAGVPIGTKIRGYVGANGFEFRVAAAEAATSKINNVTTSVEAAIPSTTYFEVTKLNATDWLLIGETELGARIAAIVPDAV